MQSDISICLKLCQLELMVTSRIIHCSDDKCIKSQCVSHQNLWDEESDIINRNYYSGLEIAHHEQYPTPREDGVRLPCTSP